MSNNALISELKTLGCDTESAMERVLGDADFYVDCLNRCLDDAAFDALGRAIAAQETREAFEHAHNLKGVTGMLGLTPLYKAAAALTESLRAGVLDGAEDGYRQILDRRRQIERVLRARGARGGARG